VELQQVFILLKRAKENNVPGADAIYNDLKRLYEEQGPQAPPLVP